MTPSQDPFNLARLAGKQKDKSPKLPPMTVKDASDVTAPCGNCGHLKISHDEEHQKLIPGGARKIQTIGTHSHTLADCPGYRTGEWGSKKHKKTKLPSEN